MGQADPWLRHNLTVQQCIKSLQLRTATSVVSSESRAENVSEVASVSAFNRLFLQ